MKYGSPRENLTMAGIFPLVCLLSAANYVALPLLLTWLGNGGFAGIIDTAALVENLNKGFAVAGGDGGHRARENHYGAEAPNLYFPFFHDRDQVLAWLRNSIAYFTPPSQKITSLFYGQPPKYSYYKGCSTGGGQGFALAQFHPHIFDGIIAGCPGNWYSHLMLSFLWNHQAVLVGFSIIPMGSVIFVSQMRTTEQQHHTPEDP